MFFMHRIKCKNETYDKGIEVHQTMDSAKQSYHAYMGAYGYGHEQGTTFVNCMISDELGTILMGECWNKPVEPEPEEPSAE